MFCLEIPPRSEVIARRVAPKLCTLTGRNFGISTGRARMAALGLDHPYGNVSISHEPSATYRIWSTRRASKEISASAILTQIKIDYSGWESDETLVM